MNINIQDNIQIFKIFLSNIFNPYLKLRIKPLQRSKAPLPFSSPSRQSNFFSTEYISAKSI